MSVIGPKFKEVISSVFPIVGLVLLLHFTFLPIPSALLIRFLIGSGFVTIGLTLFLIGVDIGITPLGDYTGHALAKSNRLWVVLTGGLVLGFFVSIAEPGLMVLANQVSQVASGIISNMMILMVVSLGLAILLAFGFVRIFYALPLYIVLLVLYGIIFVLSLFTSKEFLAIAFDASGSTTGILAVPFILSLSAGISKLKKDSKASEKDSFGLVAIASVGAILAVLLLDIFTDVSSFSTDVSLSPIQAGVIFEPFVNLLGASLGESFISILPLGVILLALQKFVFKLKKRELRKLLTGFGFAFVGLFIFLIGINAGFMEVGIYLGSSLVVSEHKFVPVLIGFALGVLTILAEPAVYVLTRQIEDVTSGYVKRIAVLIPLALGVGLAVALSILRILIPQIQLWHYLLPGYLACCGLMFLTPKLFVGIAFDAGGVATGPMTATFILAFTQGAAFMFEQADLLVDGFGMIAMVAMMPIITLQLLGVLFAYRTKQRKGI